MATPLETIDIETVTLGDLAKIYTREQGLKSPLGLGTILSKYANTPAIQVFQEDENGSSIAKQVMRQAQGTASDNAQKGALKTLRYLSNRLYNAYESKPPDFLISNEKNTPQAAQQFFGTKEPPKAVSSLQVVTDEETIQDFMRKLMRYAADNPEKAPHVRAIIFGMNTGLRPNANLGIKIGQYSPKKGAIYIPATETGAKGRAISIPLNNMADSMLQQQYQQFGQFMSDENSVLFVDNTGKPLKTSDINAVLSEIKVPNIIFDAKTGKYYDSFKPEGGDSSKFGMSLFRNYHTTRGDELGIDPGVLAKLQGRSLTSMAKKEGIGELYTYRSVVPFRVSNYERQQANILASDLEQAIGPAVEEVKTINPDFNFDRGVPTDVVQTRATQFLDESGANYFERVTIQPDEAPEAGPTVSITTQDAPLTPAENKDFLDRLLKFGTEGLKALPIVGVGIAAGAKKAEAEEMIEEGEGALPAYLQKGAEFIAEEATPYGFVPPVEAAVGAGLEAGAEALQQEAEEKGISGDIEAQLRGMFGVPQ